MVSDIERRRLKEECRKQVKEREELNRMANWFMPKTSVYVAERRVSAQPSSCLKSKRLSKDLQEVQGDSFRSSLDINI
jgi:hypothetical protein